MASVVKPVQVWAETTPDRVVVRGVDGEWTYSELFDTCGSFASVLRDAGAQAGDRIVLVAPSVPEFVVAYLAVQRLGAVVVSINTMSTAAEVQYVLQDSGARLLVAWHELGPAAFDAAAECGVDVVKLLPGNAYGTTNAPDVVERSGADTAAILYTSGTTGRPKGAELSVENILRAGEIAVESSGGSSADRIGTGLPLFHIFGQISVMMSALTAGASLTLIAPFTPSSMIDAIERNGLTVIAGVPTMWSAMLHDRSRVTDPDLGNLRLAVSGGATLPGPIARDFERRFGCRLLEGYGLTETASLGTFLTAETSQSEQSGSVGVPVPHTRIEVRDENGVSVPADTVGEVYISGPSVMKGYWNRPEDTAAALVDGWLRTGDLGTFDSDGRLRIVGRLKDLIIRGGYNVYPSEVEEVLLAHPDIDEVAVIGVPDAHYGENVLAVVVMRASAEVTGDDVTNWARTSLSAYKVPRIVQFVDRLPKGPSGKILKRSIEIAALPGV